MNPTTLQEKFSLAGRTALMTGAGRGIGRGITLALAKAGANVVALDIHEANARETANLAQSTAGVRALGYTAAKSGVAGLTRSLAQEWAPHGVRVNAIGPGFCRTAPTASLLKDDAKRDWALGRIPMKRFAEAEDDLGYVAVFLASPAAAYITGQVLYVDGGWLTG